MEVVLLMLEAQETRTLQSWQETYKIQALHQRDKWFRRHQTGCGAVGVTAHVSLALRGLGQIWLLRLSPVDSTSVSATLYGQCQRDITMQAAPRLAKSCHLHVEGSPELSGLSMSQPSVGTSCTASIP
jgi:hypothetical protein